MKFVTSVRAVPHLLGRRIDLAWQNPPASAFEAGTTLARIVILRGERTFPLLRETDGEVLYGRQIYGAPGDLIVSHFSDRGLEPLTTYYYTIYTVDNAPMPRYYTSDSSHATAFATNDYNLAERLYKLLPAVHQREDTLSAAELAQFSSEVISGLRSLPEGLRARGQLWRFFHAAAAPFNLMRSFAEGLRRLHDVDLAPPEFLPHLAQWIGWEPDRTLPVFAQRNEVKFAPHLYRSVGTGPNLRAIVNHYTGWYTQVAEFAQHIARSNLPPQLNIFAMVETAGGWRSTDDAAPIFGFGPGNNEATGSGSLPATLVSTLSEPFALRPAMELAVMADDRIPVAVRFQPGDFANIAAATAAEVARVLNCMLSEVTATARVDGRVVLTSHTVGSSSSLRVEQYAVSLVTLESAPRGRLSVCADNTPGAATRMRLFYETADPLTPATTHTALQALSGEPFPTGLLPGQPPSPLDGNFVSSPDAVQFPSITHVGAGADRYLPSQPQGLVRYKTFRQGSWGESFPLPGKLNVAQGDPAAIELSAGRVWVAWIDQPHTELSRLRFMVGTTRTPQPAQLTGQRSGPFQIIPGTHLFWHGNWPEAESFEFAPTDFANPQNVSAVEVATVLNARLTRLVAAAQPNQTILLRTLGVGGDEHLKFDLRYSDAAAALGFDHLNAEAFGDWGDEIDWSEPQEVASAVAGRHADLHAVVDGSGVVWLFWATHVGSHWRLVNSRWDGVNWSPPETVADGLGGNREPCAVLDATNRIWLFWSRRQETGTLEDIWTLRRRVFDPVTSSWNAEAALTPAPPPGARAADREPSAVRLASGDLRVFFRSDRAGGTDLWSVTVTPATNAVSAPALVVSAPSADYAPAPVLRPDGALWLLHRSDRSVPLSRIAIRALPAVQNRVIPSPLMVNDPTFDQRRSVRMVDHGTLRCFAGTTSVVLADAARMGRSRLWDDLMAYTPQRPLGDAPHDDEFYTRGTVGLYLSQLIPDIPLSQQLIERLRPALARFLPINTRAVVILAPRVNIEFVYGQGAEIGESYQDKFPFIEFVSGLEDSAAAALPNLIVLLSTTAGHVSANPADLTSLRRRTFFPPPQ